MTTHLPPQWQERLLALVNAHGWDTGTFGHEQIRLLTAWAAAEGGSATWNPLNTTYPTAWGSHDYNGSHVKDYAQPIEGVCATALTLATSHQSNNSLTFGGILGWLQAGSSTAEDCVRQFRGQFQTWGTNPDTILRLLAETA